MIPLHYPGRAIVDSRGLKRIYINRASDKRPEVIGVIDINVMVDATLYTILGGILGLVFMLINIMIVPKLLNKLTPKIDEQKEILRGNVAVARYFGGIVNAIILGTSIIIAAAIMAGIG